MSGARVKINQGALDALAAEVHTNLLREVNPRLSRIAEEMAGHPAAEIAPVVRRAAIEAGLTPSTEMVDQWAANIEAGIKPQLS